jgi:predicted MFS family arabinose efflux permease
MKNQRTSKLLVPSIVLAYFSTQPTETILSLLLIDIAQTFNTPIGIMGQIRTTSAIVTVIVALLLGVLSVIFSHKKLLLAGVGFFIISGIGCFLAWDYTSMLVFYSLSGIGLAMVHPMGLSLIGEHVPQEKRSNAIGYIVAGGASAFLIGGPVINFIIGFGTWRSAFLYYSLPLAILGAALAALFVPSSSRSATQFDNRSYFDGIKQVLSNRSAIACLFGILLTKATWQGLLSYSLSFYRERFNLSTGMASLLLSGIALSFILSALVTGKFISRFGRKNTTIYSFLILGLFSFAYMSIPLFGVSLLLYLGMGVVGGIRRSASQSLSLEQEPNFRGSMMSMTTAADNLGSFLGAGIGGFSLLIADYWFLGMVLGILGILSSLIIFLFAQDSTQ